MDRKSILLKKLAARTDAQGRPKPGYKENVATLRAELQMIEEQAKGEIK